MIKTTTNANELLLVLGAAEGTTAIYTGDAASIGYSTTKLANFPFSPISNDFIVISSGKVADVTNANTAGNQGTDLGASGPTGDTAKFTLTIAVPYGAVGIKFDFTFLSEEFPEYVGSQYNDFFSAKLDGKEIALDSQGKIISVNNNFFSGSLTPSGTMFDGQTPPLTGSGRFTTGATTATLTFSVGDEGDGIFDSAAFISNLTFVKNNVVFLDFSSKSVQFDGVFSVTAQMTGFKPADLVYQNAVKAELEKIFAKYGVDFLLTPPPEGDYTAIHVGTAVPLTIAEYLKSQTDPSGASVAAGLAEEVDYGNASRNDKALIFTNNLADTSALGVAWEISHQLGHLFGLKDVIDPQQIMHDGQSAGAAFGGASIVDGSTVKQNSDALLTRDLGSREDTLVTEQIAGFNDKLKSVFLKFDGLLQTIYDARVAIYNGNLEEVSFQKLGTIIPSANSYAELVVLPGDKIVLIGKSSASATSYDIFSQSGGAPAGGEFLDSHAFVASEILSTAFSVGKFDSQGNILQTYGSAIVDLHDAATTPVMSIGDVSIAEGDGVTPAYAIVQVKLAAAPESTVTVQYSTANGSALAGSDYVSQTGVLTFLAGVTQQSIYVELIGDLVVETDEAFYINLTNAIGAPVNDSSGKVTIRNDDGIIISNVSALEGTGANPTAYTFTVSLQKAATSAVSVNYAAENGTAIAGSDFTAMSGTLNFAPGEISKTVTVQVAADTVFEADETFNVRLSGASGAVISDNLGAGVIRNDDGLVIDDISIKEGTAATAGVAGVVVRLLTPALTPVTVNWATEPGSAAAPGDFTSSSGTIEFAIGEIWKMIFIPLVRDSFVEGMESFQVRLSNPSGAGIFDDLATVRILNDDGFSVKDAVITEGDAGQSSLNFVVTLGSALTTDALVDYQTFSGTALSGVDFQNKSGTLTFKAGETSKTVSVLVTNEYLPETDESFTLVLSNPTANTGILRDTATGLIKNNDGVLINDVSFSEGTSGPVEVFATVSLTAASDLPVLVNFQTADGTAKAGVDYQPVSGTVYFAPGETSKQISVTVNADSVFEGKETFNILLSSPVNSEIVDGAGVVTITDTGTKPPAFFQISDAAMTEGTGTGTSMMRFLVTLSEQQSGIVAVNYTTVAGTALAGADFTAKTNILNIAAGSTSGYIDIPIVRDGLAEGNEAFTVVLSTPLGGPTIGRSVATGTILSGSTGLAIAATSANKAEGQSGTTPFTFTITSTGNAVLAQTVDWTVSGAAVNGADFTGGVLPSGSVTFAPGQTSKVITIDVSGDLAAEGNEAFTVTLSNPTPGATISTATAVGTIRSDDTTLSISAAGADKLEGHAGSIAYTFTVTRSGDTTSAHSAAWSVSGAAVTAADFTGGVLPSGIVSFIAGETSKVISVNVAGEIVIEGDEAFTVNLSAPSTGAIIGVAGAAGVIRNDDPGATEGNDVLTGTPDNDTMNAGGGNDLLSGLGGDDSLNGGVGVDAFDGGAGNDTIIFDTFDSSVFGGADFDTGIFTGASTAQARAFNMLASSIEKLQWVSAGNNYTLLLNGDNSRTESVTDTALAESTFASRTTKFDAAGAADFIDFVNDANVRVYNDKDNLNNQSFTEYFRQYSGALVDFIDYRLDTGQRQINDYDQNNDQAWTEYQQVRTSATALTDDYRDYRLDNGQRQVDDYDQDNNQSWTQITKLFLQVADVNPDYIDFRFDNGSRQLDDLDQANNQTWSLQRTYYEEIADVIADYRDVFYDDNTRINIDYDQNTAFDWTEWQKTFDAAGVLTQQIITYDNGTILTI